MTYFAFDLVLPGRPRPVGRAAGRPQGRAGRADRPPDRRRSPIQLSDHIDGDGDALFAQASRMGLEGIVSKKADARYVQARSQSWVKVKRSKSGPFVVIGFLSNMPKAPRR
jgi:ATP-dependent DNA ligase